MTTLNTLDRATDETAIADLLGRTVATWDAQDADAYAELFTEDATLVIAGVQQQGKQEIRAFMAAVFAGPLTGTTFREESPRIRFVAADVAIITSLGGVVLPGGTAVLPSHQRRETWVFSRAGSGWLIESFHNCAASKD